MKRFHSVYITTVTVFMLLLAVSAIFVSPDAGAQSLAPHFRNLSSLNGLSQNNVVSILQDKHGFMWFGTWDGLNRYDGVNFKIFWHDESDSCSISNSHVRAIYEDPSGTLWFGTWGGGLNRYNEEKETFVSYRHDGKDPSSLRDNDIRCIIGDNDGRLWIGTYSGVDIFDPATGVFTHFFTIPREMTAQATNFISSILLDSRGAVWIGTTRSGLFRFDNPADSTMYVRYYSDNLRGLPSNYTGVNRIYEDHRKNIWIGTFEGLYRYDSVRDLFSGYSNDPANPQSLSNNDITGIFEDSACTFWVSTDGGGLNILHQETGTFTRLEYNPYDSTGISNNSMMSIYEDNSGILWFGSFGGGVDYYNLNQKKFIHIKENPLTENSLNNNVIRALCEDSQGKLWIGTDGGGINVLDRKSGRYTHYTTNLKNKTSINDNVITALYEDSRGTIWVGSYRGGLSRFDRQTGTFHPVDISGGDGGKNPTDFVRVIREDHTGSLWIGTVDGGLVKYTPETGQCVRYLNDPLNSSSLSNNIVVSIYEDINGIIWFATWGGGINRLDPSAGLFTSYMNDTDNPASLSDNNVICIHQDSDGVLWFGTMFGLNRFDANDQTFVNYNVEDGLPNNVINGIIEDETGCLWLSTNNGLSRFDPEENLFSNYYAADGLQGNEFNLASYCKGHDGTFFFGGIKGITAFKPLEIMKNTYMPPCVITGFLLFNKPVPIGRGERGRTILSKSIFLSDEITLYPEDHIVTFEFASLHYAAPERNQYAYYLEGFENDWNYIGNRKFASYSSLPPGKYILHVKGTNSDGVWNEHGASLRLTVKPPFWETLWFRLLGISFLALSGISIHRVVTNNIKKRNRELASHNRLLNEQIQERKLAEKALRENEERFRMVIESSRDGMIAINRKGLIILFNPAAEKIFGRSRKDMINQSLDTLMPEDIRGQHGKAVFEYFDFGKPMSMMDKTTELTGLRSDGSTFPIVLSLSRGHYGDEPFVLAVIRDITRQKQLEEQLQVRARMDSLGTLAGGIAHDFNNLLVGIMGNLELLSLDSQSLTSDQREYIDEASQLCQRSANLIKKFQTLSKEPLSEMASVDLYHLVQEVFSILERTTDKLIEKIIGIEPGRYFIMGQADQLHQVLLNLGTNAIHAIGEKGVVPGDFVRVNAQEVEIAENDVTGLQPGRYVHVMFEDSGPGMAPEIKRRAFEPFFTTKQRGTMKGQGLGLAMVFNIITRIHAGHISIDSLIGKGTVINMYLKKADAPRQSFKDDSLVVNGGNETILVVEDEESIMRILALALKKFGYTVLTATDGQQGVDLYLERKNDIDLVLLDLTLPKMSGRMVLDHILAINAEVKVIISSGQSEEEMRTYSSVKAYVLKPYKMLELSKTIRSVLDGE